MPERYEADLCVIVLAGGSGRRLGSADKPVLPVAGTAMLERVLAATDGSRVRVVVGPAALPLPAGVGRTQEQPPGSGPVAALAAGLAALGPEEHGTPRQVSVLAGDLPLLTADAVDALRSALTRTGADVAVYRDPNGRRQLLCGVWWEPVLLAVLPAEPAGVAVRTLLSGLHVADVEYAGGGLPPWYDCDTPEDLARADAWARADAPVRERAPR
jgi:molybdopterin-guanine dinucleotide biosynthesis protein A